MLRYLLCRYRGYYIQSLQSATVLRKGNVFTSVCQEFFPGGRRVHPAGQTPPPPGRPSPNPGIRLLQQTVRTLLECILVLSLYWAETMVAPFLFAIPLLSGHSR